MKRLATIAALFIAATTTAQVRDETALRLDEIFKSLARIESALKIAPSVEGEPFYGMRVESAEDRSDGSVVVVTTGARYVFSASGVQMWRLIEPATNSVNARFVARLAFDDPVTGIAVKRPANARSVTITSSLYTFVVYSDSLLTIQAKTAGSSLVHTNLIADPQWDRKTSSNSAHIYTDGDGGSVFAAFQGRLRHTTVDKNSTRIRFDSQDALSAHMVFPPKRFDFEKLYGKEANPFTWVLWGRRDLDDALAHVPDFKKHRVGSVLFFEGFYTRNARPVVVGPAQYGYRFQDDIRAGAVKLIAALRAEGVKTYTYLSASLIAQTGQSQDVTLAWMREFQKEHSLNGWYLDNANHGGSAFDKYKFMTQVRRDVGDGGIIVHHRTVDPIGRRSGVTCPAYDAYTDAIGAGETGSEVVQIDDPNNPYIRYVATQYGIANVPGLLIWSSKNNNIKPKHDEIPGLLIREGNRVTADLHGRLRGSGMISRIEKSFLDIPRSGLKYWLVKQKDYLGGNFDPAVKWPVTWWREATDVKVSVEGHTATVSWRTVEPTFGKVVYVAANPGDRNDSWQLIAPTGKVSDGGPKSAFHSVDLTGLTLGKRYFYRIVSTNQHSVTQEVIYGAKGSFVVPSSSGVLPENSGTTDVVPAEGVK